MPGLSDWVLNIHHAYHAMQPVAAVHNTAFFVGTGAVLRRSNSMRSAGVATGSITEDIHTSLRLDEAGYRSVYVDEALGYMLAADTPSPIEF